MAEAASLILLGAVLCELALMLFIFCIARFYELKFKENTYQVSFLIPAFVFVAALALSLATGLGLEWDALLTSACALLVMATAGLFLYRKMMGVSR